MDMDDGRLVKQAFLQRAVLGPLTHSNSAHKSWAGQVRGVFPSHSRHALRSQHSSVSECQCCCGKAAESSYLESVNARSGVKMQQYLHLRSEVDSARDNPAAYLQAVGG